jgi:plasmid stabilization system protein ParE
MASRVSYKPAAVAEIDEAFQWYERERPGLGLEFLSEIARVERHLAATPELYQRVEDELRRAILRRFPHGLFYLIEDGSVVVLACMHLHRDPATRLDLLRSRRI